MDLQSCILPRELRGSCFSSCPVTGHHHCWACVHHPRQSFWPPSVHASAQIGTDCCISCLPLLAALCHASVSHRYTPNSPEGHNPAGSLSRRPARRLPKNTITDPVFNYADRNTGEIILLPGIWHYLLHIGTVLTMFRKQKLLSSIFTLEWFERLK